MGEARVALPVHYLENVRGHRRRDTQSEIASGPIDVVQQPGFIGRRQRGILTYHRGASCKRGRFPESG